MSRIGKKIINLPANVKLNIEGTLVSVEGPKGKLSFDFNPSMKFEVEGTTLTVVRPNDTKEMKTIHGTTRALLANMIHGCSEGFSKKLLINGIGYRAALSGKSLVLNMGYSHEVVITPEEGVKISAPDSLKIVVEGIDAQKVGQTAARIRAVREPEPYKGKGIKYVGEFIIRKEGKRAGKK